MTKRFKLVFLFQYKICFESTNHKIPQKAYENEKQQNNQITFCTNKLA